VSRISRPLLVRAISAVEAMDRQQQEDLAEDIFKQQPNLFSSILALNKLGVDAQRMGFSVRMLLVCFQAMRETGTKWPTISQQDLTLQLTRWLSSVQRGDDLGPALSSYSTQVYVDAHPEQELLAYVTTSLVEMLRDSIPQESDRFVMMAVLNLVNCIAYVDLPREADSAA